MNPLRIAVLFKVEKGITIMLVSYTLFYFVSKVLFIIIVAITISMEISILNKNNDKNYILLKNTYASKNVF